VNEKDGKGRGRRIVGEGKEGAARIKERKGRGWNSLLAFRQKLRPWESS